jgi:apolipoprotein N-acyltransferase
MQENKNAEIMYLLSSEKFFNNSIWGKKQYNNVLKLRCVENKIPMIKSSNYGSSFVINSKGKVLFKSNDEFNIYSN